MSLPERTYLPHNGLQHRAVTITNFLLKTLKRKECSLTNLLRSSSTCFYLARFARPEFLWSVNILARVGHLVEQRLWSKIAQVAHIHQRHKRPQAKLSCGKQKTKIASLGCYASFAGDLQDSKSTSGGFLCGFGSHTFVPTSWMCKKQSAVSHSCAQSKSISHDAGVRIDGVPAPKFWACNLGNYDFLSSRKLLASAC